jgi:hypothetical protein
MKTDPLRKTDQRDVAPNRSSGITPVEPEPLQVEEDDVDAQEYVRQLIARMGPGQTPDPIVMTPVKAVVPEAKVVPKTPVPGRRSSRSIESAEERNSAPLSREKRTEAVLDIEKLREAVSLSTTSQLDGFDRRSLTTRAYRLLSLAAVGIVMSLCLASMVQAPFSLAHIAATLALVASSWCTVRFFTTVDVLWRKIRAGETPEGIRATE